MARRQSAHSRNSYDKFESRCLLAGNVTVVSGEHLYIRGDADDNQFQIVVEADEMKVVGLSGTTINGRASLSVAGTIVGDSGVRFPGGLRANLGPGHDEFAVTDAQFEAMSIIYGGNGDDHVEVTDAVFMDKAVIQTFNGNDTVSASGVRFDGDLFTMTLDGEDSVTVSDSDFGGNSFLVTGNHQDTVVSTSNRYHGETNLVLPLAGNDTVHVNDPVVDQWLGVFLGDGDDTINAKLMDTSMVGNVVIGGQAGTDEAPVMEMHDDLSSQVALRTVEAFEVFDGGVDGAANVDLGLLSNLNEDTNDGDRYATPIVLDTTTTISTVEWTGFYERDVSQTGDPDLGDRFVVEIYEGSSDGAPDSTSMVQFEAGLANRVDSGETGVVRTGGQVDHEYPIYNYSADVEFTMEAGKEYWVSIYTVIDNDTPFGSLWNWGARFEDPLAETVHRLTWTPDSASSGDNNWRNGGEDDKRPHYWYSANMDIRLRS